MYWDIEYYCSPTADGGTGPVPVVCWWPEVLRAGGGLSELRSVIREPSASPPYHYSAPSLPLVGEIRGAQERQYIQHRTERNVNLRRKQPGDWSIRIKTKHHSNALNKYTFPIVALKVNKGREREREKRTLRVHLGWRRGDVPGREGILRCDALQIIQILIMFKSWLKIFQQKIDL